MKTIRELIHYSGGIKNALIGLKDGGEFLAISVCIVAFYLWLFVCITKI